MHDGAPPHWKRIVVNFLNETYPGRWFGRFSPTVPWPPRSPDLNPLDYFLWGYVKNAVYNTQNILSQNETQERIQQVFESIRQDPAMITRATEDIIRRVHFIIGTNGQYIENLPHDHSFDEANIV